MDGRRVARNVGWNFVAQAWLLVLALVTTPVLVRGLGVETYGVFSLVLTVMGYLAVLDLGLGVATIKYVSECRGRGDRAALERIVGTSLAAYLALGAVGGVAIALAAPTLARRVLDVPADLVPTTTTALLVAAAGFALNMPLALLGAIPAGLQRMDITNRWGIVFGSATLLGAVVLVRAGIGLVGILLFSVAVGVVAIGVYFRIARRLLPDVSLRPRLDRDTLRLLAGFGSLKFANQAATHTVYHVDKLLVGALLSVSAVTYFAVPLLAAQKLTALVANVATAFLPAASELYGSRDEARFRELYVRASKVVALLVLPAGLVLILLAEPLLSIWMGGEFAERSAGVFRLLVAGYALNAFTTIPALAADSVRRPGVTTAFSAVGAVVNVVLSLALIPVLGIEGAGLAIVVHSVVLAPLFLLYVHRRVLRFSAADVVRRALLRPVLAAVLAAAPIAYLARIADDVASLTLALALGVATYAVLSIAVGSYDSTDRRVIRDYLRRAPA